MRKKTYELIEHTADIGIRVKAGDLKALFTKAARAMFDIVGQRQHKASAKTKKIKIKLKADNLDELFVDWLNELLSLSAVKELVFSGFKIDKLDQAHLEATVTGKDIEGYRMNTEIKAATYHQLKLTWMKPGWQAEVIFDV